MHSSFKKVGAIILGLSAFLVTGCFDIEQTLTLERNLSGKAGFSMKVDMEPMVYFMTQMQREMSGKKGPPTAAELDAAKKDVLKNGKTETTGDFEKDKKEMQAKLPKGITLLDAQMTDEGLKMGFNLLFGFDNMSKLALISMPKKEAKPGEGPPGGGSTPMDSPFGGLKVVDDGKTILVTSDVKNPVNDAKAQAAPAAKPDPEMEKQMQEMFKGLRVAFKITAPFTVLEQNATRKEGNTLIWEYDLKSIVKMKAEQLKQGIRVKYKK